MSDRIRKVAIISIAVMDKDQIAAKVEDILQAHSLLIISKVSVPFKGRFLCTFAVIIEAEEEQIDNLSFLLSEIPLVRVETMLIDE